MINDLFATKAQRIAAYRAAWTAIGIFLTTWLTAWLMNDAAGLFDKLVIGPAIVAGLGVIFVRGGIEGTMDRGNTTVKPEMK